jgi:hypothetical protein
MILKSTIGSRLAPANIPKPNPLAATVTAVPDGKLIVFDVNV